MKPTRPAPGGEVALTRVVPLPAVLLAIAPNAVVRLARAAVPSALRVRIRLVVSAVPIVLTPAHAVVRPFAEMVPGAKAPVIVQVGPTAGMLATAGLDLHTVALAIAQVAPHAAKLARAQVGPSIEALASEPVALGA